MYIYINKQDAVGTWYFTISVDDNDELLTIKVFRRNVLPVNVTIIKIHFMCLMYFSLN